MIFVDDGSTDDSPQYLDSHCRGSFPLSGHPPGELGLAGPTSQRGDRCSAGRVRVLLRQRRLARQAGSGAVVRLRELVSIRCRTPQDGRHRPPRSVPRLRRDGSRLPPRRLGDHGQPDPAQALSPRLPRRAPNPFPGRKAAARGPPLRVHRVPAGEDHQHLCRLHLLLPHPPRGLIERRIPPDRLAGVFRESLPSRSTAWWPGPSPVWLGSGSCADGCRWRWCSG